MCPSRIERVPSGLCARSARDARRTSAPGHRADDRRSCTRRSAGRRSTAATAGRAGSRPAARSPSCRSPGARRRSRSWSLLQPVLQLAQSPMEIFGGGGGSRCRAV